MTAVDQHPDVIQMAANLCLDWRRPSAAIVEYCCSRIGQWLREEPTVRTIAALEDLVCRRLGLVFEEFTTDEALAAIIGKYVGKGEGVFASQQEGFDHETFATLIRRDNATPHCPDRFVALIDCRGEKAARRFFTRWHETAHVLTLVDGQMTLPFHRSKKPRHPIEQLMDKIAGVIGFYDPLFRPPVVAAVRRAGRLNFDVIEKIRQSECPTASFQATMIAVTRVAPVPAVTLEAGLGLKKHEERFASTPGLFPEQKPEPCLRVLSCGGNEAARRTGLRVHQRMRVPPSSAIATLFGDPAAGGESGTVHAVEDLATWTTSDGSAAGTGLVHVEAMRRSKQLMALITRASSDS